VSLQPGQRNERDESVDNLHPTNRTASHRPPQA
jgi:hypothetical protein